MTDAAPPNRMLDLLTLEPDGDDRYFATTPSDGPGRLFGGQVASQTLRAATLTVDASRAVHSLHAYFIRPGRPGEPLQLTVDRTRDGRSFTTRRVTASQSGGPIFTLAASFHVAEQGDDWQLPAPSGLPDPESIDPATSFFNQFASMSPLEVRTIHPWRPDEMPVIHPFWVRARAPLPDDPGLHAAVLTFISDMGVVGSTRAPGSSLPHRFMGASLDHAVWFHRPARADEWLLFSVDPVSNAGARGLARGAIHTLGGVLVASVAQEALLRDAGQAPVP
jgi:acyl-CoA thioesterase-2